MKIAVKDANILIDLIEADLLGLWFRLGIETYTTDLVRFEIKKVSQRRTLDGFIEAGLLKVESSDSETLATIRRIKDEHGVSLADASTFVLARKLGAALLSGDDSLRKAAKASDIETCGVFWVFDRLIEKQHLSKSDACVRLRRLLDCGSFLPRSVCDDRFRSWGA
jgi:predicted nucleic acid-binding protein